MGKTLVTTTRTGQRGCRRLPWLATRGLTALAFVAMLTVLLGGFARADNVVNTVVVGSTDTTVVANGIDSITVGYAIVAANDQRQSGSTETGSDPNTSLCNVRDDSPATVTINVPAGVTSSHRSLTFTVCDIYQYVTFTATTSTAVNVSVSVEDADKLDYYTTTQATFTLSTSAPNTAPILAVPANILVEAANASGAIVTFNATGNDAEQGALTPTCTPASGATFPLGTTTVNCSVTDNGGLTAPGSFTVTVVDSTLPTLTLPASQTLEATSAAGAVASFSVSASDTVSGALNVTCDAASGSTFSFGSTTVTCSATDAAGNKATGSFTVTVQDTTAPDVTAPGDVTVEATGPDGAIAAFDAATASDIVDGSLTATCDAVSEETVFALGDTTVTCTATDAAGNPGSATFTVTVQDTTAPDVTATASDIVDGSLTATCDAVSEETVFELGTTTVTCSATDAAGNPGSASFTVTVQDTTAPAFGPLENLVKEATGPNGAIATYVITATDLVDGSLTATCSPTSGSTFALGVHTVACSATDAAGNTDSATFTVTVEDTTAPTLVARATANGAAYVAGTWTNQDVTVSFTCADGGSGPAGNPANQTFNTEGTHAATSVTCQDLAGNVSGSVGFGPITIDKTAPVVSFIGGPANGATYYAGYNVPAAPTCSALEVLSGLKAPCEVAGYSTAAGTHTMTVTATDNAGNVGTTSRTYTVALLTITGFYQPVDMGSVTNTIKAGSTVPLKFEIFAGTTELTSTSGIRFTVNTVSCGSLISITDEIELTTTGLTSLRYDSTGGQFIQNWQTPKTAGVCYRVAVYTGASEATATSNVVMAYFKTR